MNDNPKINFLISNNVRQKTKEKYPGIVQYIYLPSLQT